MIRCAIVYNSPGGPRSVADDLLIHGPGGALTKEAFPKSVWNRMVKEATTVAMEIWKARYLPLRFKEYAKAELGYRIGRSQQKAKERKGGDALLPNVWSSATRDSVLSRSSVKVTTTNGTAKFDVIMPRPRYAGGSTITGRVLDVMTDREAKAVLGWFMTSINSQISGTSMRIARGGRLTAVATRSPSIKTRNPLAPR